jgi:hypothetical protein
MSELLAYLLKVHVALIIFYLIYRWFLRKLTFYNLNRYYLLGTLAFSALYPLIDFHQFWKREVPINPEWVQFVPNLQQKNQFQEVVAFSLEVVFWALFTFFLLRFGMRLMSLWHLHRRSVSARWFDIPYRRVFEKINPFSFLHHIYVNTDCHKENELSDIFMHEYVHVKEKHSWDMIFVEVFTAFGWFNPVVWLYRFAIHENLEFITDRRVLESGVDKQEYQFSLLHISVPQEVKFGGHVVSHFNLRQLKRRIAMMNTQASSKWMMGRYAFSFPIVFGLIIVFGFAKGYQHKEMVQFMVQNYTGPANGTNDSFRGASFPNQEVPPATSMDTLPVPKTSQEAKARFEVHTKDERKQNVVGIRLRGLPSTRIGEEVVHVVFDGVRIDNLDLSEINPDQIASVNVVKNEPHSFIYLTSKDYINKAKEESDQNLEQELGEYFKTIVAPKRIVTQKGIQISPAPVNFKHNPGEYRLKTSLQQHSSDAFSQQSISGHLKGKIMLQGVQTVKGMPIQRSVQEMNISALPKSQKDEVVVVGFASKKVEGKRINP